MKEKKENVMTTLGLIETARRLATTTFRQPQRPAPVRIMHPAPSYSSGWPWNR